MRLRGMSTYILRTLSPQRLLRRARAALSTPSLLTLLVRSRFSRVSLTGAAPVVVSLTSYGPRIRRVHLTLESFAGGRVRPQRVILWLEDRSVVDDPPPRLRRMVQRGLEIRHTEDWGPHKKYYPYAASLERHGMPLVTADDDVLYGYRWLSRLVQRHREHPEDVIAHRAHRVALKDGRILPYFRWQDLDPDEAGPRTFATGHSGVLYPPAMLDALREAGTGFTRCAPRADDIWLHAVALRAGITVRPVDDGLTTYRSAPGAGVGLAGQNVWSGANDRQIAATYTPKDVELMWRDQQQTTGRRRLLSPGRHRIGQRSRASS